MARIASSAAAALSAGLALAACSATHPSAHSTTSTTTAASSTTTTVVPAATTTTGAGAPAKCRAADLALSVEGTEGAAGTIEVTLQFRNISAATCTMNGYPGAQLYDNNGAALATTVVPGGTYNFTNFAPAPTTVAAGGSAYVNFGYSDVPTGAGACPTAASMWVTPPDAPDHLVVTQNFVVCNGKVTMSPVFGSTSPEVQTTAPPHA
ncbi:MAG TPA: DUF4232 domain-containing protein [Acidimicrobiales bacterium]|nr:DUF4232 domain-containing protein [Acidimicrobiales bacterium]